MTELIWPLEGQRIFVAGHRGMVGSALVRRLEREPCEVLVATREEMDLRRQEQVEAWLAQHRPDAIILAAATVGGIVANDTRPAEFIYDNLMIEANVIHAAHQCDIDRLLFLGSSCIYPRLAEQPIREEALLTGPLEPTNEWYAIAKIAGLQLCRAYRRQYGRRYISAMPTNLYGPEDNFHPEYSHVIPALIRRFDEAQEQGQERIEIWGTGTPLREFLHVDDLADALVFLLQHYDEESHINVGSGEEVSILELAHMVAKTVGFAGQITLDISKPDGTPRKLLETARLRELGWHAEVGLEQGLVSAWKWFSQNQN